MKEPQTSVGGFNDSKEGVDGDNISDLSGKSQFDCFANIDCCMDRRNKNDN